MKLGYSHNEIVACQKCGCDYPFKDMSPACPNCKTPTHPKFEFKRIDTREFNTNFDFVNLMTKHGRFASMIPQRQSIPRMMWVPRNAEQKIREALIADRYQYTPAKLDIETRIEPTLFGHDMADALAYSMRVTWPDFLTKNQQPKGNPMEQKKFFVVSALQSNSSELANLKKYETKEQAIERAKEVINLRRAEGRTEMGFYILEVSTYVGTKPDPIHVVELKSNAKRKTKKRKAKK